MTKIDFTYVDIFGVPVYKHRDARRASWSRLLQMLYKSGLDTSKCSYPVSQLQVLVVDGFLSPESASYYLTGRASLKQILFLDYFIEFYDECLSTHVLSLSKIRELWLKRKNVVPENTFLFPLAELDSSLEDEKEFAKLREPMDLRELQNIK